MKLLSILGARPQFIKAGALSREIAKHGQINEIILHTGQHYDENMSDIFFKQMQIPKPHYFLGISSKTHGQMTGRMMEQIESVALKEKPDFMVVYGDTNSTLAGALVASKLRIKLAHIEAGLRSFNTDMPEEINRILTDRVSDILFCPTDLAINNLKKEGYENFGSRIVKSGDIMQESALFYKPFALKIKHAKLQDNFILCTIHRAENTDNEHRLREIFSSLNEIAKEVQILMPLHPRTKKQLEIFNINAKNLSIIPPVGYLEMIYLLKSCSLVFTDSGGLQKEAYFFDKYCMTFRNETEWVELVDNKFNFLVGTDKDKIMQTYNTLKNHEFIKSTNLYGDGKTSQIIISELFKA